MVVAVVCALCPTEEVLIMPPKNLPSIGNSGNKHDGTETVCIQASNTVDL